MIDRTNVRKRCKYRKKNKKESHKAVASTYFDSRKDAILVQLAVENRKLYK